MNSFVARRASTSFIKTRYTGDRGQGLNVVAVTLAPLQNSHPRPGDGGIYVDIFLIDRASRGAVPSLRMCHGNVNGIQNRSMRAMNHLSIIDFTDACVIFGSYASFGHRGKLTNVC